MRFLKSPMRALALAVSLVAVSSCASRERVSVIYPPSADLAVEAKPRLDAAALVSEAALDAHDSAVESWGERGWLAVGRLCRWSASMGAKDLDCPPPRRPDPG